MAEQLSLGDHIGAKSPSELVMWQREPRPRPPKLTEEEIDLKYTSKEERIVTESNREKLPNFVEALKRPNYMNLRPFYQRRRRWDVERQSQLIESFIMNIPVPPLFLYETQFNTYEVMDGQQRITAIKAFYDNELELTGLERWPELNGLTYTKLPPKIRAGIDRRSISYIVLLTESAATDEDATLLKQLVFERLNTGGVRLANQEVRNCLYQGQFNSLLIELARHPAFRRGWGLPQFTERELTNPPDSLLQNKFYARMHDVELVLRFFALRHVDHYQRGMQGFLDLYMVRSSSFTEADITFFRQLFTDTIELAYAVYGDLLFKPFDIVIGQWSNQPQVAFADAVMVGFSGHLAEREKLIALKERILGKTKELFQMHEQGTFTGRGNTKRDIQDRLKLFNAMLANIQLA
jgi:Protein of unknown function DUF262